MIDNIDRSLENILSIAKYAVHRGCSRQMAYKLKDDNRLVLTPDGKSCYVKESDERVKLTKSLNGSFYDRKAKEEKEKINKIIEEKGLSELTAEVNYQQLDLETDDADILFKNARALREKATALQAAAEHEKFIGSLVERTLVEKILFERARQFRDGITAVSKRLAPMIINKGSIREVELEIDNELIRMLDDFANLPVIE